MEDNVLEAESPCRASKKNHHDHGQSALEMAALAPLVLAVLLFLIQGIGIMVAASQVRDAARDGARAAERGDSVTKAVHSSLPEWIEIDSITACGRGCVKVSTKVPIGVAGFFEFTRFSMSDEATFRPRSGVSWL